MLAHSVSGISMSNSRRRYVAATVLHLGYSLRGKCEEGQDEDLDCAQQWLAMPEMR